MQTLTGKNEYLQIISKKRNTEITRSDNRPKIKILSAYPSYLSLFRPTLRIDKKERKQLDTNSRMLSATTSSTKVAWERPKDLTETNTKKQKPRRFDEAFRMWGVFSLI